MLSSNGPSERPSKAKSEWETGPRRSGEAWCDGDGIAIGRSMARRIDRDEHRRQFAWRVSVFSIYLVFPISSGCSASRVSPALAPATEN